MLEQNIILIEFIYLVFIYFVPLHNQSNLI